MALQASSSRLLGSLLTKAGPALSYGASSGSGRQFGSADVTSASHFSLLGAKDEEKANSSPLATPAVPRFMAGSSGVMMLPARRSSSMGSRLPSAVPFAMQQAMAMSTARQVQSGSVFNSTLLGIYRFWRNQAPFEKPHGNVDSRLLPSLLEVQDARASVGIWATALFCTIISCNLLGLVPFNEAPTSGLGFATGLGVSVWATATTLGLYKLGFTFPGHFIPGGTPWPMAFIFVPLETISYSFRAVSLGVRLWVNMLAGHTLLHILTGMSLALPFSLPLYTGLPATVAVGTLLSALIGLEYLVAVLQSGVFSILSTVYIGEFNHNHIGAPLAKMVKKH